MKKHFLKFFLSLLGLIPSVHGLAQGIQLSQPVYTACPNQIVTVTATWPNVGNVTYSLASPAGGSPGNGVLASNVFTVSHSSTVTANVNFTLSATGTSLTGQVSSSVVVPVSIVIPAPLTLTNQVYYCPGNTAQIIAPLGGTSYNINSTCFSATGLQSNIINIPNLAAVHNCTYLVTSVGSCTRVGTTTISVAPATPITANSTSNVCQGGTVALTANLPTGQNYQWYDPYGTPLTPGPVYNIVSATPNSAGTYTVTADFPFNNITCPRIATALVNVVATSAINVAASPSGILCQGDKLTFNAGASNNVMGWTWSGPQGFNASTPNPVINPVTPLNTGVYTVTALFTNNVITCNTQTTIPINIVTVNSPIITMPSSVCKDATLTLGATASGAVGYTWFGPNNFSGSGTNVTINGAQPNASGIYYVTAKFGLQTTTCAATSSAQLNVVPVNTVSIIPPTPVCQPDNGNLQASAIGANQYLWQGPNGFTSPGPNATIYYPTPSASGVYTVTAYFIGNNLTCQSTNTTILTVNPILVFSLTPRQQGCYQTSITVNGPVGATGYSWTSSTGFTSNNKDITFNSLDVANAGTYTLNVSLGPCITSGSTTIDVLGMINYTLTPLSRTICKGDTAKMEIAASGGSQNYAYTWNPSTFLLDGPVGPKKEAVLDGSMIYNVTAHDIACPNYTISHQFTVNVLQPPKPVVELEKTRSCAPFLINIDPKTQSNAAFTTYDFGGDLKIQPLEKDANKLINYVLKDAGTYSLTITSKGTNGCTGVFKLPYPLIVDARPGADIKWYPETPTTNDVVEFEPLINSGPVIKYLWEFSGGVPTVIDTTIKPGPHSDTSVVKNPTRKYSTLGLYPVMLIATNTNECTDTVVKFMQVIDDFKVYVPNAFTPNGDGINDLFMVKGSGMKTEGFSMELSDRWGNQVFFTKDISEGWDGTVNGKKAENGVYVYKLKIVGMNGEGRKEFVGHFSVLR